MSLASRTLLSPGSGSQFLLLPKSEPWSASWSHLSPDTGVWAPRPSFLRTQGSRPQTLLSRYPEVQTPSSLTRSLIPGPSCWGEGGGRRSDPSLTDSGLRVTRGARAPARVATSDRRSGRLGRPARSSRPPVPGSGTQVITCCCKHRRGQETRASCRRRE